MAIMSPEGVREVIGRRLDRLAERCDDTLTIASVVGHEFTLERLSPSPIEDISRDRLLEVLDEALSAPVTEELPRSVGMYQFTHALIQETLQEELSLTLRAGFHARIAEALEALYRDRLEAYTAELAHHYAKAQTVLGVEKLVRYSLLAGERALGAYALGGGPSLYQADPGGQGGPPVWKRASTGHRGWGADWMGTQSWS